ncbi:MAG: hypothetical protein ACPGQL_07505 [Thermoplasmatota archaeon]
MVATVEELLSIVRLNPYIDGIGYFIEVTTLETVNAAGIKRLNDHMRRDFSPRGQVSLEGDMILGLDFHDHIPTQGDGREQDLEALRGMLEYVELNFGIDHLCIEFQFDIASAREAQVNVDELLQP